jgi:hypothetical protein
MPKYSIIALIYQWYKLLDAIVTPIAISILITAGAIVAPHSATFVTLGFSFPRLLELEIN